MTARQKEILTMLGKALSIKEIAEAIGISRKCVEYHIHGLHQKFKTTTDMLRLIGYEFLVRDAR